MEIWNSLSSITFLLLSTFQWNHVVSQRNGPVYTLVAPSKLRPNMNYHICATVHNASAPVDFAIQINGVTSDGNVQNILQTVHVDPRETKVIDFQTQGLKPGNYSLKVSGSGGLTFENETELFYEHKSYSVFIQTDRAVYKPGQVVQFRSIVVDPSLKPAPQTTPVDLSVRDAHNNLIEEWKGVRTTNGVAAAEFLLADHPVLGEWNVHVDIKGQKFKKHFDVAEFILPTYEVQIDLPTYVTYNKSDVVATVKAMYSFGKPVKGEVTLTVAPRTRYNILNVRPYESFQTKAKIDGTVDVYLNLLHDLNLRTDFFKREIEFFALVEEEETGHKYNSTNTLWIYDKEIKVELIRTSDTFKPGLKYTAFLKVAYQDDTPASDNRNSLQLKYGYSLREAEWKTTSYVVPRNGIVKLEITPPNEDYITFLNMRATYKGQTYYIDRTFAATSPSSNFMQVILITPNPKVDDIIELEVNATEAMTHLVYKVIGTGNIQFARTIPVPNQKIYRFSFRAPAALAPRARVLVYYVRSNNNEIVADSVSFDVEGVFHTTVTVSAAVKQTQPGNSVSIRIETKPDAFIGILGVDQGILKVKSGNDITQADVIEELETYDGGQETKHRPPWYRRRKRSLSWPGSKSSDLIFLDSGTVIMTNALLPKAGNEDLYPENAIYTDDSEGNTPIQPPSELPGAEVKEGRLVLRKNYPSTWLWINTTAGYDGSATVSYTVPGALTSWAISSFAVHLTDGLGITPATDQVTVYRPFFITMSLPYVVLMGESLAIQVVVFSYNKKTIQAEVTMENRKGDFEFTAAGKDTEDIKKEQKRTKIVYIPPSDGVPVSFLITPLRVGDIEIRVTASSSLAGDSIYKKLLVRPEGSMQNFNNASVIDFRTPSGVPFKVNVSTVIPRNAIRDSGKIKISTYGDLMAPMLKEINHLLYVPVGCGEPNLVSFVPHLIALQYLSRINKITPFYRNRAISSLRNGYQRQLTYKREDGSFSTFGERDKSGSTWLTAFAVKSLHQAEPHIVIDHDVIDQGLQWIIKQQNSQGSFEEPGEVHHKALQGGAVNGAALTAFVLMSLLENQVQEKYGREMSLAQRYIEREFPSSKDPYVVAIITYVLHLIDSPSKDNAFQLLLSLAERTDDGAMYWKNKEVEVNTTDKQSDYYFLAPSVDVETAAYGLLTFASRFDVANGVSVLKWLISKQNKNGGFSSSQDTVVALHAISQMAPLMLSLSTDINIKFTYPEGEQSLTISTANAMEVKTIEIPSKTPYVEVEARGTGVGVVQVSWEFNLAVSGETPAFFLNALLDKTSTASYLQLSICTHKTNNEDSSNMAVMEVGLPSGYVADVDALPSILQIPKVKRVGTLAEDTTVVIYFDRLDREESCVTVPAHRIHKVAHQRRAPVRVYDYYNQSQSARMFYRPHKTVMCDVCDDSDCGQGCDARKKEPLADGGGTNSGRIWRHQLLSFLPVILTFFVQSSLWKIEFVL